MTDPDLAALLRSPALGLEPPADLLEDVHRGARRTRRNRAVGTVALSVLLLAGVGALLPDLVAGRGEDAVEQVADGRDPRFPEATSTVAPLIDLNGGSVLTFFRGRQWCTASVRSGPPNTTCAGSVGAGPVLPFAFLRGPGTESLTVDRDYLVAGVLGDGVEKVVVELEGRGALTASTVQARDWPRGVWWQDVQAGERVLSYAAYGANGTLLSRREP